MVNEEGRPALVEGPVPPGGRPGHARVAPCLVRVLGDLRPHRVTRALVGEVVVPLPPPRPGAPAREGEGPGRKMVGG